MSTPLKDRPTQRLLPWPCRTCPFFLFLFERVRIAPLKLVSHRQIISGCSPPTRYAFLSHRASSNSTNRGGLKRCTLDKFAEFLREILRYSYHVRATISPTRAYVYCILGRLNLEQDSRRRQASLSFRSFVLVVRDAFVPPD